MDAACGSQAAANRCVGVVYHIWNYQTIEPENNIPKNSAISASPRIEDMRFSTSVHVFRWSFIEFDQLHNKTVQAKLMTAGSWDSPLDGGPSGSPQFRPPPRFVNTHLPFSMNNPRLLDVCKVVYVARNPKDACVSYFNFSRLNKLLDFTGDLEVRPATVVQLAIGISVGHRG